MTLTDVYGPPWPGAPRWQRFRWAIRPAVEYERVARSPWVELWRP